MVVIRCSAVSVVVVPLPTDETNSPASVLRRGWVEREDRKITPCQWILKNKVASTRRRRCDSGGGEWGGPPRSSSLRMVSLETRAL